MSFLESAGNFLSGGGGDFLSTIATGAFNAHQADKQRDWSEWMSSSAHQREVADLRLAGLNPVLAAGGSGASSPFGASASASALPIGSSISNARVARQNIATGSAQEQLLRDQQVKTRADTAVSNAQRLNVESDTALKWANVPLVESSMLLNKQNVLKMIQEIESSKSHARLADAQVPYFGARTSLTAADAAKANVEKTLYKGVEPLADSFSDWMKHSYTGAPEASKHDSQIRQFMSHLYYSLTGHHPTRSP